MGYVTDCYGDGCGWNSGEYDDPSQAADELAQHLHHTGHSGGSEPHEMVPDSQ